MDGSVGFREWVDHYIQELMAQGVGASDALTAARLGWEISRLHQICFGDEVPVDFDVQPKDRYQNALATCCGDSQGGSPEKYVVYPLALWVRVEAQRRHYQPQPPIGRMLRGIAVHEERHRVQDREAGTLVPFVRGSYECLAGNLLLLSAAQHVDRHLAENERIWRQSGESEEHIALRLRPQEFDAWVVTHVFIEQADGIWSDEQLVALVRMNAPRVPRP